MSLPRPAPLAIDGTTLEGGGQLLRLSLALSSLTRTPFHITDIRGKRGPKSHPGKAGGMKAAHLAGAQWLTRATRASTRGLELKSRDLLFQPRSADSPDPVTPEPIAPGSVSEETEEGVWKYIYSGNKLIRKDSTIAISSPGSVFLILQAILPWILFASATEEPPVPVRLTLKGGTNVWHSMSLEYCSQVLFPVLHVKLGLHPIRTQLLKRGWSQGSSSSAIGEVQVDIQPQKAGWQLPSFTLSERGEVTTIHVSILAPGKAYIQMIQQSVTQALLCHFPDISIEFPVLESSGHDSRVYLLLVAETSQGFRLGRDWLYDQKVDRARPGKTVEKLVGRVVEDLRKELEHGGCVDEYLQDQLVVFQALATGRTVVRGGRPSLHTRTARWVVREMVGVVFDDDGGCEGIGFFGGARQQDHLEKYRKDEVG